LLVNCDVKGLEVVVAAELSGDRTLSREVIDKVNFHADNQQRFGLPDRVTAKRFMFKLLYGASAFGYAHDGDFTFISTSDRFWQKIIDEFYAKYGGIKEWHTTLMQTARATGRLEIPSGRYFPIVPKATNFGLKWPDTVIKNYPVQGFGADLVMLARLEASRRLRDLKREFPMLAAILVSTIHDSIVADCPEDQVEQVGKILFDSVEAVPALCKQVFGYEFKLPLTAEVQYGPNKLEMKELTFG
jgi:DNA polymerase-1